MQNRDSSIIKHLTIWGLLGASFIPVINIGVGIYITTLIPFVILFVFLGNNSMKLNINKYLIIYSLLLCFMFISIIHSYYFLKVPPLYRDFMEWLKYLQFLPYFLVISYLNYDSFALILNKYVKFISIFIIIVIFFEYTDIFNLGHIIGSLYASPDGGHYSSMFSGLKRLVGTGSDPNIGAMIISFFLVYNINDYFRNRKLSTLLISILLIISVLLTQSRTVLIGLVGASLFILFIVSKINIFIKIFYLFAISFIVYLVIYLFDFSYITIGIETALKGENASVNARIENYLLAFERFNESPYFGIGPAKAITSTIIDSEYALIIQRYGLFGCIMFLMLFFNIFKDALQLVKKNSDMIMNLVYLILCLVFMVTNNVLAGYQLGGFVLLIIIIIVLDKKKLKRV